MNPSLIFPEGATTGQADMSSVQELRKALEAGYGTDVSALTGGGALRIQSLDTTMMATIQQNQHFTLFNALQTSDATATVDEWTEQDGVGGFPGGSTNTETGGIGSATGEYARRTGSVKYLMTRREVSLVTTLQNNITDAETIEQNNGALQLLTDAEHLCFEGDSTVVPTEYDGIYTQLRDLNSSDHIIDLAATPLDSIGPINSAAAVIAGPGNFGRPTDLYCSFLVQSDFDTGLDPAFRVALDNNPNSLMLGAPVTGIRTSHGNIKNCPDVFIRDEVQQQPFELQYPAIAAVNNFTPQSAAPVASAHVDSKFQGAHAGNYYYLVAGVNAKGQSVGFVSAQVAVASGDRVTLTIGASAADTETGYVIYRSRRNGSNAVNDFREMARIGKTGASTAYVDYNTDIPGCSKAYVLNMQQGQNAITWRQLLPMMRFELYPTNSAVKPWAQLLFGYLRIAKRKQHVVIKNILPNGAKWQPFV